MLTLKLKVRCVGSSWGGGGGPPQRCVTSRQDKTVGRNNTATDDGPDAQLFRLLGMNEMIGQTFARTP